MQALLATSRSVNQDQFIQRQKQRKYNKHISTVRGISEQKVSSIISQARQIDKLSTYMNRSKSTARAFKTNQIKAEVNRQNKILYHKIMEINVKKNQGKPINSGQSSTSLNWVSKKKEQQTIKQQNRRMATNLINIRTERTDYKKKMEKQIRQYLQLKKRTRKFKTSIIKNNGGSKSEGKFNVNLNHKQTESKVNEEQCVQDLAQIRQDNKDNENAIIHQIGTKDQNGVKDVIEQNQERKQYEELKQKDKQLIDVQKNYTK